VQLHKSNSKGWGRTTFVNILGVSRENEDNDEKTFP